MRARAGSRLFVALGCALTLVTTSAVAQAGPALHATVFDEPVPQPDPQPDPVPEPVPDPLPEPVPEPVPLPTGPVRHVIQPHDTIVSVAARYGMDWHDLASYNELSYPYRLQSEGVLRLNPAPEPLAPFTTSIARPLLENINWHKGCPVPPSKLREVSVTYLDFDGLSHQGTIVVHRVLAQRVQVLFKKLYDARYRIYAMAPLAINTPGSTDETLVTMSYNCRRMTSGRSYSRHAYGTAIDINPGQNPYVSSHGMLVPAFAVQYRSRVSYRMGIVHRGGTVVRAFAAAGLKWGGLWKHTKDYMHFSLDGR